MSFNSMMSFVPKVKEIDGKEINDLLSTRPLYRIRQFNGQRWYGPPIDGSIPKPLRGSEIIVKGIPSDCFEDELVPFFEKIGPIYQLRRTIQFSGIGRQFAFVEYADPFMAQRAVTHLNPWRFRANCRIKIEISYDNKRLRIEDISMDKIQKLISLIRGGLEQYLYNPVQRWATLYYSSHHMASQARRVYIPPIDRLKGTHCLEWVPPKEQLQEITAIWIRGLYVAYHSHEQLKWLFTFHGVCLVQEVMTSGDLIHVQYVNRHEAQKAFNVLSQLSLINNFDFCWDLEFGVK